MVTVCVFPRRIANNPGIDILANACEREGVRYFEYDWLASCFRKMDVFHVHWPDATVMGDNLARASLKTMLFLFSILILSVRRKPILYSVHNIGSNDAKFSRLEGLLWRVFLPRVSVFQHFNRDSVRQMVARWPRLASAIHRVIPHPNYRSEVEVTVGRGAARAKLGLVGSGAILLNFGRLRPYKGVEELVGAFRRNSDANALLVIAGPPADGAYGDNLKLICSGDPRIRLIARFVPEHELSELIAACDVVVLAHRKINNSGVALVALSSNRAILAPARGAVLDMLEELGPPWVTVFEETLDQSVLATAIARARQIPEGAAPDLSSSNAEVVGRQLTKLYTEMAAPAFTHVSRV